MFGAPASTSCLPVSPWLGSSRRSPAARAPVAPSRPPSPVSRPPSSPPTSSTSSPTSRRYTDGLRVGSAGFIVFDDQASIPRVTQSIARFLYVESCNQCAACKHGLGMASGAIDELFDPAKATFDDFERALYGARSAPQGNRCYLPVQGSVLVPSLMNRYKAEFDTQLAQPEAAPAPYLIPKMVDFDESTSTFSYDRKT